MTIEKLLTVEAVAAHFNKHPISSYKRIRIAPTHSMTAEHQLKKVLRGTRWTKPENLVIAFGVSGAKLKQICSRIAPLLKYFKTKLPDIKDCDVQYWIVGTTSSNMNTHTSLI